MHELVHKLLNDTRPFTPASHCKQVEGGHYKELGKHIEYEQQTLATVSIDSPPQCQHSIERARKTGR